MIKFNNDIIVYNEALVQTKKLSILTPMADMLIEQNLRWTGHVHRMDEKILYLGSCYIHN